MRTSQSLIALTAIAIAAIFCVLGAVGAAALIETRSAQAVSERLLDSGIDFVVIETDGLQVHLSGTAPTEAARFRALQLAGSVIDAARLRDKMEVAPGAEVAAPRFSVEILRNDDGISVIGLIPTATERSEIADALSGLVPEGQLTDLLETATYPVPDGWELSLAYGIEAVQRLPRSKVSIAAYEVAVTAIGDSDAQKRKLEADLARMAPEGVHLTLAISAPRPVITPFTLRFVIDERGARFDACSADTEAARDTIIAAAIAQGVKGKAACTVGLGVPTPRWAEAAAAGISAIGALGQGNITFSDADVSLIASENTPQATFDRVVGELDAKLPDVFSLTATLPEKPKDTTAEGPADFTATLSPEGQVQLRGRLTNERLRDAVDAFAKARFGANNVFSATRLDDTLPDGWPVRVLAALEALAQLENGAVVVQPQIVAINGKTGDAGATDVISRILSDKLGPAQEFDVSVEYDERLDPIAGLPTPEECVAELNAILAANKITFAPGSVQIDGGAAATIGELAENLKRCGDVEMEIGGHTDSQGRDEMNLSLSQARAEAVLTALMGRRISVAKLSAKGYGETVPIAGNDTEEGREANRRIEFKLVNEPQTGDAQVQGDAPAASDDTAPDPLVTGADTSDEGSGDGEPGPEPYDAAEGGNGDDAAGLDEPAAGALDNGSAAEAAGEDDGFTSSAPKDRTERPKPRP